MNVMTKTTAAAALALAAASPAVAGNLSEPVVAAAPAPVMAPMTIDPNDWTGFYAGGSVGYAEADDDGGAFSDDFDGATYGIHAGYDYDFGSFVMGGELEISNLDLDDSATGLEADSVSRLKVRAGYDAGSFMPYVTAGVAQLRTSGGGLGDADDTGGVYGLGLDYRATEQVRVGGEVLRHEFDDYADSGIDADATTATLRVSYEF